METKKSYILSFSLLTVLLAGHILGNSKLVLFAVALICGAILVCKKFTSTSLLFFFFPFSYIFAYKQYSLCIFMAVAYIFHVPVFSTETSSSYEMLKDGVEDFICENSEEGIRNKFSEIMNDRQKISNAKNFGRLLRKQEQSIWQIY